jgi:hypothetical protein
MKFDLDAVDTKTLSEAGVDLRLKMVDGVSPLLSRTGLPVTLRLLGPDSKQFRIMTRSQVRKRLERKGEQAPDDVMDEAEADAMDVLCACTVGWSNLLDTDGVDVPFTAENVRAVYMGYPVIRDQVDYFVAQRVNFLPASSGA